MTTNFTMRDMLEAGVHFGHQKRFWNPKMAPYIYGEREKLHIINLEKTFPLFAQLLELIAGIVSKRGKVLFVGTKYAARDVVREEAIRCGMPYVDKRWLGGMLTNYKTIRQSIRRLKDLEATLANPKALFGKTKKEVLTIQREKEKLSANLDGIKNMGGLPDLLFIIDAKQERTAILEARRLGIPVAAIVDTNVSPEDVDYMVPGNDDAIRAIRFYCKHIADVVIDSRRPILEEAQAKEKERAQRKAAKSTAKKAPEVKTVKTAKPAKKVKQAAEVVVAEKVAEPSSEAKEG
ncbi:MAG: 30S ribosomal protein S2 [Gammaproteobacteria bacterium RIFCSPHIGHO2_12_FULL_42_13]|nr:MAG: 30S ribosomal protein S2 [Gammaproteobacteria bacterium RIFCSPHIGHO2_12_FULL_42_13]